MRIAQVSPWFYPHLGGVESHVRALSKALAARGHEVTVVTTRHDPSLAEEESMDGFRLVRVKPRAIVMRTPIAPKMRASLRTLDTDVFHGHFPPLMALWSYLLPRLRPVNRRRRLRSPNRSIARTRAARLRLQDEALAITIPWL